MLLKTKPSGRVRIKLEAKKQKARHAATPEVEPGAVADAGSLFKAALKQEEVTPAPTNGADSEVMGYREGQAPPPDAGRGEHHARGKRPRTSTRRSSLQGPLENRDS